MLIDFFSQFGLLLYTSLKCRGSSFTDIQIGAKKEIPKIVFYEYFALLKSKLFYLVLLIASAINTTNSGKTKCKMKCASYEPFVIFTGLKVKIGNYEFRSVYIKIT